MANGWANPRRRTAQRLGITTRRYGIGLAEDVPPCPPRAWSVSARIGPARTAPAPQSRKPVQALRADLRSIRAQDEGAVRAKREHAKKEAAVDARRARDHDEEDQRRVAARRARREREEAESRREQIQAERERRQAMAFVSATGAERLAGLRAKIKSPAVVRELFVLKEILEPPISMRSQD